MGVVKVLGGAYYAEDRLVLCRILVQMMCDADKRNTYLHMAANYTLN